MNQPIPSRRAIALLLAAGALPFTPLLAQETPAPAEPPAAQTPAPEPPRQAPTATAPTAPIVAPA
ncbi:lytic murein transglycosylase, partial [Sphingomonas parva]